MQTGRRWITLAVAAALGCGGSSPAETGDASASPEAGSGHDATSTHDAATSHDATLAKDAIAPDATSTHDAPGHDAADGASGDGASGADADASSTTVRDAEAGASDVADARACTSPGAGDAAAPNAGHPMLGVGVDFGVLDNFYRATQLQGNLSIQGQGLMTAPAYLLAGQVDLPYLPKPCFSQEILFVDTFSITRFLGGQTLTSVQQSRFLGDAAYYDDAQPWRTFDYARTTASGQWEYLGSADGGDLVGPRLSSYLAAGYSLADITLVLSNVPWAASRTGGTNDAACYAPPWGPPGGLGMWGECNPPADAGQWETIVQHLASDLSAHWGSSAAKQLGFEVGDEYDSAQSFNGFVGDYESLFDHARAAIGAAFPTASFVPGDFTGRGMFPDGGVAGYDTKTFLDDERARGFVPDYVPRSLNALWDSPGGGAVPNYVPTHAVVAAATSFARLDVDGGTPVVPEIHQFGFLDMPPPLSNSTDESSIAANWNLQALIGLKGAISPRRVFHWDTTVNLSFPNGTSAALLNGVGFVNLLLDHYQGSEVYELATSSAHPDAAGSPAYEGMAVALWSSGKTTLILSNFDAPALPSTTFPASTTMTVTIPPALLTGTVPAFKYLRVSLSPVDNAFARAKADLAAASTLSTDFANCAFCISSPQSMATTGAAYDALVKPAYVSNTLEPIVKQNLTWRMTNDGSLDGNVLGGQAPTHALTFSNGVLTVTLEPDEMLVLMPP